VCERCVGQHYKGKKRNTITMQYVMKMGKEETKRTREDNGMKLENDTISHQSRVRMNVSPFHPRREILDHWMSKIIHRMKMLNVD
jgi:hypothetical protein